MRTTQLNSNGVGVNRPKSGDNSINQHTPTRTIADYAGREAMVAGFGEQVVGFKTPEILAVFNYFVNPKQIDISSSSGDYTITTDASRLKLTAGASASTGQSIAQSVRSIIYHPGHDSYVNLTIAFDSDLSGTTQEFGPFDGVNGYVISLTNSNLSVKHFSGGVLISTTESPNFKLDTLDGNGLSGFVINPQNLNLYRISYGYLGLFPASFEIYGGADIGWIVFHYIDVIGSSNKVIIEDPYLPIWLKVTSDGTNEVSMYSGSWQGGVIAGPIPDHLGDSFTELNNLTSFNGGGTTKPIFTIKSETTFKSKTNKIEIDLRVFNASADGNKLHNICIVKNAALTSASFNSVATDSVVSIDKAATGMLGGEVIRVYDLGKVDSLGVGDKFEANEIRMKPGETLTAAINTSSTGADVGCSMHWVELK